MNPMCYNCLCLHHTCEGTTNQAWTGCIHKKVQMEYEDSLPVTLTFSDIADIAAALQNRLDAMIKLKAPSSMLIDTLERAKKFNIILKHFKFNHYTDESFDRYEKYIREGHQI